MGRLRTFIAIDMGEAIRDKLVTLQESLRRTGADVKWVETENLHVTLLFLGEVDERQLPPLCQAVSRTVQSHARFDLAIEHLGAFPSLRRPRVVWVGAGEGAEAVLALHDALEEAMLKLGCYRREERQYTPHITLGRLKREGSDELAALLARKADWHAGTQTVTAVQVMSSELTPQGPLYTVLSTARLGGSNR